jgi:hypothetical protein
MMLRLHRSTAKRLTAFLLAASFLSSCKKDIKEAPAQRNDTASEQAVINIGNSWAKLTPPVPDLVTTVTYNLSFSVNDKVYVLLQANDQLWEFDPATALWTVKKNNFTGQPSFTYEYLFTNGARAYFGNLTSKVIRAYDFSTDQWSNKASFPGTASKAASFTATGSKGYILSGAHGSDANGYAYPLKENWEYDFAADTWLQKGNTPASSRYNAASYAIGDKIYFGTGISIFSMINPHTLQSYRVPVINADWWEYNTLTNTWTQKAAFGGGSRQDTRGFVIAGKIYLGLGTSEYFSNKRSDLWSYDATANTWTQKATYPPGNAYPPYVTTTSCNGRGYAVTGNIYAFWRYTPSLYTLPVAPATLIK